MVRCFLRVGEDVTGDGEGGKFWEFSARGEEGKEIELGEFLPTPSSF